MCWHCEDAAITYSTLPVIRERWHAIVDGLRERFDIFDDWGMFSYTNGAFRPGATTWSRSTSASSRRKLDEEMWEAWVDAKREIARVAIEHGGSITACHGSCREGEVDLVPMELGGGFEVMKKLKRALDPNNIMNPGKYLLDQAYEEVRTDARLPALRAEAARGAAGGGRRHQRLEHVFEVDPALMPEHVASRTCPSGTSTGSSHRWEHLAWMHDHFADSCSPAELLEEIEEEERAG